MAASSEDFGDVDEIDAEAIGEPGHRTFRLLLERHAAAASLWMEKEQLEALGLFIQQQIAPRPLGIGVGSVTLSSRFPAHPTFDFKVGRLAVGFDAERSRFVFTAHPVDEEGGPALRCAVTQAQAEALGVKIATVAAAGRPRCALCGAPIEGQHICPLSNGHLQA